MKFKLLAITALATVGAGALNFAHADPCGMVPPMIMVDGNVPIERVGAQKTFVFHKDGVETMVLRPGFKGKVDQFGMLIPFPSPPAVRKVNDNIFPHIAAAIDPPEVIAWVNRRPRRRFRGGMGRMAPSAKTSADSSSSRGLRFNQVKVVNQEAVGMYEVAVLAAGSAQALKKWMDRHGYKYPKGMDRVTNDYVRIGWYFVAVKTRVGNKGGVNPRAGMRKVSSKLPSGSTFNGFVQAMGFRFKSKKLVVPMRLSAFNKGKLRNIVYILSDGPRRIRHIPRRYVVRQITGKDMYRNVTKPLPLRVMGGTFNQLSSWQKQQLKTRRNPAPYNALAKELFASDLMAVRKKRLSNPSEEIEKNLLNIGERLNMRGAKVDALHAKVLKTSRNRAVSVALKQLKNMSMTVVDGEFLRKTIAKENLTFAWYRMSHRRNKRKFYDSRIQKPAVRRQGKVYHGSLLDIEKQLRGAPGLTTSPTKVASTSETWKRNLPKGLGLGFGVFLFGFLVRRKLNRIGGMALIVVVAVGATMFTTGFASAEQARVTGPSDYIKLLKNKKRAKSAVNTLVRFYGKRAVDDLLDEVVDGNDLGSRGWAIVALSEIGGTRADSGLAKVHANTAESMLVRSWAASARINMTKNMSQLMKFHNQFRWAFPATARPLGKRMAKLLAGSRDADKILLAVARMPQLRKQLNATVIGLGSRRLIRAMMTSKNNQVRRFAASYLGGMARKPNNRVGEQFIRAVRFRHYAKKAPWHGGALFLPGVQWTKAQARRLAGRLVRWHLWAEMRGNNTVKNVAHNNLRQWQLARKAGYKMPNWRQRSSSDWLRIWGKVVGKRQIRSILWQQGAMGVARYRAVLSSL